MGVYNIWIPGGAVVYVAPELITHYMEAHEYLPPEVFRDAVRKTPLDPERYADALLEAAPPSMGLTASLKDWLERLPRMRAEGAGRKRREFRWSWKDS